MADNRRHDASGDLVNSVREANQTVANMLVTVLDRNLEEMMLERGLHIDHTTIYRWVQRYAPELEKRCRPHLNMTNDSWRVDETSVKIKKTWMSLYQALDSEGNTLEFLLSPTRATEAAKRFFSKTLAASHTSEPRVITVDKNAAYLKAFNEL